MSIPLRPLAFACAFALSGSVPAHAVNLTGTWVGSYTCQGYNGSAFKVKNPESTLLIVQQNDTFVADLDGGSYLYNGSVINDLADATARGEAVMNQCTTDSLPLQGGDGEIIRLSGKVNAAKGTGTLKGIGILESIDPNRAIITCKYKYKLLSTDEVDFGVCPAL